MLAKSFGEHFAINDALGDSFAAVLDDGICIANKKAIKNENRISTKNKPRKRTNDVERKRSCSTSANPFLDAMHNMFVILTNENTLTIKKKRCEPQQNLQQKRTLWNLTATRATLLILLELTESHSASAASNSGSFSAAHRSCCAMSDTR
jgi:hypothetical protein